MKQTTLAQRCSERLLHMGSRSRYAHTTNAAVYFSNVRGISRPEHQNSTASRIKEIRKELKLYGKLSKKHLSALVVSTSAAGYMLAGGPFSIEAFAALSVGTSLCAMSAATFNQIYERETDKLMKRTRMRPLPTGQVSLQKASWFATISGIAGPCVLLNGCGPVAAALGLANIILYAGVYTPMKPKSEWNTWVGAIVGAIPPLMGYAASSFYRNPENIIGCWDQGLSLSNASQMLSLGFPPDALLLSGTLFIWQFPHFFSLAFMNRKDYSAGGHKMVPSADPTGNRTARLITNYSILLSLLPFAAFYLDATSIMFPLESIVFNGYVLSLAKRFEEQRNRKNARKVFLASLWYLPLFMALMIIHKKQDRIEDGVVETFIRSINSLGKELCVHELFTSPGKSKEEKPFCLSQN